MRFNLGCQNETRWEYAAILPNDETGIGDRAFSGQVPFGAVFAGCMNITGGNISSPANGQDLKDAFTAFGEVSTASIIKDKFIGESHRFRFAVTLYSQARADAPEGASVFFILGGGSVVRTGHQKKRAPERSEIRSG